MRETIDIWQGTRKAWGPVHGQGFCAAAEEA
jgi:hypothetical protein